jgi:hypothetical protein
VKRNLITKALIAAALAAPMFAQAESQLVNGTGNAAARLNFSVVVPRVLFLGVGTGASATPRATDTAIDTVSFNGATGASTTNVVSVHVFGNSGQITIDLSHPINLLSGTNAIPFTAIGVTSSDATNLPAPAFSSTGAASVQPVLSSGTVTNRSATWTFAYTPVNAAPGSYTGTATYTASAP